MTIQLSNPTRRPKTFVLDHPEAMSTVPYLQSVHNRATGELGTKRLKLQVPDSITVPAEGSVRDLPDWVADLAIVKQLGLRVVRVSPLSAAKPAGKPAHKRTKT